MRRPFYCGPAGVLAALLPAVLAALVAGCGDDKGKAKSAGASSGDATAAADASAAGADGRSKALAPVRYLSGHTDGVHAVEFSPDGKKIVTASHDGTARLWDAATGEALRVLVAHEGAVNCAVFSRDGKWVATGGTDGLVLVWDADNGDLLSMMRGHLYALYAVAFTPDGDVISAGQDMTVRRWKVESEKQMWAVRGDPGGILCAAVSRDGALLATGGGDGNVIVWDTRSGRPVWRERVPRNTGQENELRTRQGQGPAFGSDPSVQPSADDERRPPAAVMEVDFTPDGSRLLTRTHFGPIHEWESRSGRHLRHLEPPSHATAMGLSPDGGWIFIAAVQGTNLWNVASDPMELATALTAEGLSNPHAVAFSPNGRLVALAHGGAWREGWAWNQDSDNRVIVWDLGGVLPATRPTSGPATGPASAPSNDGAR